MEHELSVVNLRTEMRFLTKLGVWRIFLRRKEEEDVCKVEEPVPEMGIVDPLPTMT